ncbi:STYKc [Aspergillus sclerotialis]|uniref:non-specific serine/threonine protein kinase n=1 Tax=Aspergillus sclerotialis TaxID=2070753 RepID=A0A3A2ZSP1_9EURO|nr:STYKc [Aspergillus sclerotialis]
MSRPRVFQTSGFDILDPSKTFEEKTLPDYLKERYYPVHIGKVFKSQYQVVTKLGFGSSSTIWLCRDLLRRIPEIEISKHLKTFPSGHVGEKYVRLVVDSFVITGPHGVHPCLLYQPAGADIRDYMHSLEGDTLPENLLRPTLRFVLVALDYLHKASVIHTDVQPNNILLGIDDESILAEMEEDEVANPAPRKQLSDHTIYATRAMPLTSGEPLLADIGEARIAEEKQTGRIMPGVYRAPEVMMGMDWDNKVDIWALGQMAWTLFEQGHLFRNRTLDNDSEHAQRFAEMISLLGPPPVEFLRQSNWKGLAEIPNQSLESRESRLESENKVLFLQFLRKTLRWLPEERPTAEELFADEWVRGEDY